MARPDDSGVDVVAAGEPEPEEGRGVAEIAPVIPRVVVEPVQAPPRGTNRTRGERALDWAWERILLLVYKIVVLIVQSVLHPKNVWIQEWRAKLGFPKVMKVCILGQTIVLPTDASLVRNIVLSKAFSLPRAERLARRFHKMIMGDDPTPYMFAIPAPTPYVKAIRRCYAASFTRIGMKQAFHKQMKVMEKAKLYLKRTQGQEIIDLQDFFTRLMLNAAGKVELDIDFGGLDKSSPLCDLLIQCGHHTSSLATTPFFKLRTRLFPNSKLAQRINQDFKALENQWVSITREVCNRGEPDKEDVTLAANLRRVCIPGTTDPLPFNLLKSELATAIVGGFDSVGHQLAWIFALLATHPDVVERLLDELKAHGIYGDTTKELEFEDLSELKYLTAVIKEGMRRLHTMVIVSGRVANQDLVLDGYRIPKGTELYIPSNYSMNCEMDWDDHLAFKPERWLEDEINVKEKYLLSFWIWRQRLCWYEACNAVYEGCNCLFHHKVLT